MKVSKIYIGSTFSWDWVVNWKDYVDLAKRFHCRWVLASKLWQVPTVATSIELCRAVMELVPHEQIIVRDFDTGKAVAPVVYTRPDYLRRRSSGAPRLPFQCVIEGPEVYLSLPLDDIGQPLPEHALYYGLAKVGCAGVWDERRGFHLRANVREATTFIVRQFEVPIVGIPYVFEEPFVCELYDKIMKHQPEGVGHLAHRSRAILADDMGLGKTMQAILAAEQIKMDGKGKGLLIICPVTLVSNWHQELRMWGCEYKDVTIVPYSQLKRLAEVKKRYPQGKGLVVIADEAHMLKRASSQRTKLMMQFVAEMPQLSRLWFLTGTPVTRDFADLWPLAHMIGHPVAERYRPSEMDNVGSVKVQEIRGAISTHMLCRKKSDILTLPPKIQTVHNVDTGADFQELFDWEVAVSGTDEELMKHLMRLKRLTAEVKTKHTLEMARQILAEGRKVVLFSDHTAVLDELQAALSGRPTEARRAEAKGRSPEAQGGSEASGSRGPTERSEGGSAGRAVKRRAEGPSMQNVARICGQTAVKERGEAVRRFQEDDSCRVFLGHIKAAGVGITLTAASDVVFNDFDWLPANMQQAEDRCYRIGQKGTVNVYYMADCNLVLDDILCTKLADRSAMIATFEMSKQSIMSAVKEWVRQKG